MNKLSTNDYKLLEVNGKEYVFLTGSQEILEITNPSLAEYFKTPNESQTKSTNEDMFNELSSALIAKRDAVRIREDPQVAPKQVMLTLNTTRQCNMVCTYCFAHTEHKHSQPMSLSTAERAIKNLVRDFPQTEHYLFYFFGGEPLLYKDFIRQVVTIVETVFKENPSKKYSFLLNTNGLLLDDENFLLFLKEKDFCVTVSIDGPKEVNDQCRLLCSEKGSYEYIMKGINALQRHDVKFNLRATISPKTKDLLCIFKFFENLRIPYAYAFTISATEKDERETAMNPSSWNRIKKEYLQVFNYFTEKLIRKEVIYNIDFRRKLSTLEQKQIRAHGCEAGRGNFFVDEYGYYYTCQNMLPYKVFIGNIHEGIIPNEHNKYKSQFILDLPNCYLCWARFLCGGGCQTERKFNRKYESTYCQVIRFEWEQILLAYIKESVNNN